MHRLILQIEHELAKPKRSMRFEKSLEHRYQHDINAGRRRHLAVCLVLGTVSFNSFLIWKLLLQPQDFLWAAAQMLGISLPCATLVPWLLKKLPVRYREHIALLPSYAGLLVVYNIIVNGLQTASFDQTLFIFCWPLMMIYVNTCMKSPFGIALRFNLFALTMTGLAIYQTGVPFNMGGLMITAVVSSAFFTLLGNRWAHIEGRRSYLYRLREELRSALLSTANHDLQRLSETDPLTGLANRRQMQPHLDRLWARHACGQAEGAVLLIDVDHFKRYNDHYGHLLGDDCLRAVAVTLKKALRPQDTIARFGGEEFVVLLTDIDPASARQIAARLLQSVRDLGIAHLGREDGTAVLTVSLGMAHSAVGEPADSAALLDQADRALYTAKRNGRDRLEHAGGAPAMDDTTQPTPEEVRAALADDQFELYFQPLYQLVPHRLIGYECLLRWQHPQRGAISPDVFIDIAERSGLIGALGDWVLERACAQARHWPAALSLSVNLSPLQLVDAELPERFAAILARQDFPGERLVLELTEGAPLVIDTQVSASAARLGQLGVRLALDDFGSGHANLAYLLRLPFQILKIDRQALRISDPAQRRQVLTALLALGRAFSLEVLAEGVESLDDLALLRELGYDHAQGYLLGRPQPIVINVAQERRMGE
jgi:diguanylate cyclase (GGDEF)-like protein